MTHSAICNNALALAGSGVPDGRGCTSLAGLRVGAFDVFGCRLGETLAFGFGDALACGSADGGLCHTSNCGSGFAFGLGDGRQLTRSMKANNLNRHRCVYYPLETLLVKIVNDNVPYHSLFWDKPKRSVQAACVTHGPGDVKDDGIDCRTNVSTHRRESSHSASQTIPPSYLAASP
jgi:hypothetical protein